jgi:surface antigen
MLLLGVTGCSELENWHPFARFDPDAPGPLGKMIDRPAPSVAVTQGGPSGRLIGGTVAPDLPEAAIDRVVAVPLREWLTFEERRNLAVASEAAASVPTNAPVAWQAKDGRSTRTASGIAVPVADVYRSKRGEICRDVSQRVEKNDAHHVATITLCREAQAEGQALWLIGSAD